MGALPARRPRLPRPAPRAEDSSRARLERDARASRAGGLEIATAEVTTREKPSPAWRQTLNLAANLTLREIRSQYKRTALGRLWSLVNPLATIAVFAIIFGLLFQAPPPEGTNSGIHNYALFIATGIIPWTFISTGIQGAMAAYTANIGLLTKVYFPRHVLVTSSVVSLTATFLVELGVLAVIMAIFGGWQVVLYVLLLIPIVVLTAAFVTGIGFVLATAVVYFRDIQYLWGIVNQVWFYASGIVFTRETVVGAQNMLAGEGWLLAGQPLPLATLFDLNPAHQFLTAYRDVLYDYAVPGWETWLQMLAWSAVSLGVGWLVYRRYQARIVEEL